MIDADPVTAEIIADAGRRPPGGRVLLHRRSLAARSGERDSPELATMVVDLKRYYFQLRPQLSRVYSVLGDWAGGSRLVRMMGFTRFGEPVLVGGRGFQPIALDFGPGRVDGWIARHIDAETRDTLMGIAEPTGPSGAPVARDADGAGTALTGVPTLSTREREVLVTLAEGLTNQQLADRLFISERTANRHVSNIFTKLGVRNRTAAARIAIEAGLTR